jgi:hypothetical protein
MPAQTGRLGIFFRASTGKAGNDALVTSFQSLFEQDRAIVPPWLSGNRVPHWKGVAIDETDQYMLQHIASQDFLQTIAPRCGFRIVF